MPHRRHAANETEVLPKPFTIPLLNGEVTVNLQPNSSSWVWIVTEYFENIAKSFYTTVPDQDGVLEHTELVHISPSSLPAPYDAVEPVWWAEQRSLKELISSVTLESQEALSEAQAAIETGRESVKRTQHNASVAGAYADESRQSSYDAREYRDEAEQWRNEAQEQADRAATGPESAAQRAEDAAQAAETSETRARGYEDDARNHAAEARSSETTATGAASTATERASDARNEANRAESEANRAQGYADELMDGPREYVDQTREARDDARGYATDAQSYANTAQDHADSADASRVDAQSYRNETVTLNQEIHDLVATEWVPLQLLNGWHVGTGGYTLQWRQELYGIRIFGHVRPSETTSAQDPICDIPSNVQIIAPGYHFSVPVNPIANYDTLTVDAQGVRLRYANSAPYEWVHINVFIPTV
jgi:hypothetical protein